MQIPNYNFLLLLHDKHTDGPPDVKWSMDISNIRGIQKSNIAAYRQKYIHTYIHTITPVFPQGLGRGVPMYTHGSPGCFRSHVIGGEPIANNRAQILTPSCY